MYSPHLPARSRFGEGREGTKGTGKPQRKLLHSLWLLRVHFIVSSVVNAFKSLTNEGITMRFTATILRVFGCRITKR